MHVWQNEGVRIALPIDDGEIDVFVSIDSQSVAGRWIPVRVIAARSEELFGRFEHIRAPSLLVAIALDRANADAEQTYRTFALTPAELTVVRMVGVIVQKGSPTAACMAESGHSGPQLLQSALEPFVILPGEWRKKFTTVLRDLAP